MRRRVEIHRLSSGQARRLALAGCVLFLAVQAQAARVALVIGNGAYDPQTGWSALGNPGNDADAIARVLREDLKFDRVQVHKDVDRRAFIDAIDAFGDALTPGDTAFFYFSGHGAQGETRTTWCRSRPGRRPR